MNIDLRTRYLGMELSSPLALGACPLTERIDVLKKLEDFGVAAAVMPSLFEEQIEHEEREVARLLDFGGESFGEALSYLPELQDYNTGPDGYLRSLEAARKAVRIPIIASVNGTTPGGWVRHAKRIEGAGAAAIELNIYLMVTDPELTADDVEHQHLELIADIRAAVQIPLAVKLGPYFTSLPNFARRLEKIGVDGLVLFNRFLQPDFDLTTMRVAPTLALSTPAELRLPLRWVAILRDQIKASLAATGGVHSPPDLVKLLLAGADVVMIASCVYEHGPAHVKSLLDGLKRFMVEREYPSVSLLRGALSQRNAPDGAAFERANYMKALTSFTGNFF